MKLAVENHTVRKLYGDLDSIRIIAEAGFDGLTIPSTSCPRATTCSANPT